jgi:anti-sigma regulatory factor (Ser/Thr protein kinase)
VNETTVFRSSLAPRLDELPRVRRDLRRWLSRLEVPRGAADDIVLAAWELCANAIEHPAEPQADVTIVGEARPRGIRVAVRDPGMCSGEAFSRPNRGLGPRIVEGVVDRLAIRRGFGATEIVLFRGTRHTATGHA